LATRRILSTISLQRMTLQLRKSSNGFWTWTMISLVPSLSMLLQPRTIESLNQVRDLHLSGAQPRRPRIVPDVASTILVVLVSIRGTSASSSKHIMRRKETNQLMGKKPTRSRSPVERLLDRHSTSTLVQPLICALTQHGLNVSRFVPDL